MNVSYINNLAYMHSKASGDGKNLPAVMFLGGFKSDMNGTKAIYLEEQCKSRGQEFVRFDYSGHGLSGGEFTDGTIGSWKNDVLEIMDNVITRDVILVGSSMGGWISLLLLFERGERIKGMVGIAAAPDFTRDIEAQINDKQRATIEKIGWLEIPNDYSDEPYIFTKSLLDDGSKHSILDKQHDVDIPIILIQGKQDTDVPWGKALKIQKSFKDSNVEVVFIDDGDHRLSRPQDLEIIDKYIVKLSN